MEEKHIPEVRPQCNVTVASNEKVLPHNAWNPLPVTMSMVYDEFAVIISVDNLAELRHVCCPRHCPPPSQFVIKLPSSSNTSNVSSDVPSLKSIASYVTDKVGVVQSLEIIKNVTSKLGTNEPSNALVSLTDADASPVIDGVSSISIYLCVILHDKNM